MSLCLSVCVIYTFVWFFASYHEFFSCVRSWRLSTDEGRNSIFEFRITLPSRHHTTATFSGPERNLNHKRDIKWDTFSDIYPVLPWSFWHVRCSDISKHNLVSRKRLEKKREIRISKLCVLGNFVSREVNLVLSLLPLHLHSFPLYSYLFIHHMLCYVCLLFYIYIRVVQLPLFPRLEWLRFESVRQISVVHRWEEMKRTSLTDKLFVLW